MRASGGLPAAAHMYWQAGRDHAERVPEQPAHQWHRAGGRHGGRPQLPAVHVARANMERGAVLVRARTPGSASKGAFLLCLQGA